MIRAWNCKAEPVRLHTSPSAILKKKTFRAPAIYQNTIMKSIHSNITKCCATTKTGGAVFGEIWVDSRSTKFDNFPYKMRLQNAKSNLGERAGATWPVRVRIMLGSFPNRPPLVKMTLHPFSAHFTSSFWNSGAIFGNVGRWRLLLRAM